MNRVRNIFNILRYNQVQANSPLNSLMLQRGMATTGTDEVLFELTKSNKGIITLNRPKVLNSLNLSMIKQLHPKLQEWDKTASCVIIKGSGGKAFCAGGDVVALTEAGKRREFDTATQFFSSEYCLNYLINCLKVPYVAILDGITMGGGVGLSVHGRYRIATEKTLFAMPETAIGFFPDVGGGYFLPRLPKHLGTFLGLTGYRLRGSDAYHAGIATHYCPSSKLPMLEQFLLNESSFDEAKLESFLSTEVKNRDSSGGFKEFSLAPYLDEISHCFGVSRLEDVVANLSCPKSSVWAKKQLEILHKMSPVSMKVTLRLMQKGSNLSLRDDLALEYGIASRMLEHKDFYEGVRAVLKDKDNTPKWNPDTLELVTDDMVDEYFEPLEPSKRLKLP